MGKERVMTAVVFTEEMSVGSIRRGEADVPQQTVETRIRTQRVEDRFDIEHNEVIGVSIVGFPQPFESMVALIEAGVNSGEEVWRNVFFFGRFPRKLELFPPESFPPRGGV